MQGGFTYEIDRLGSKLSLQLHCPVHYPAFGKNLFECKCEVTFPVFMVRGGDWEAIRKRHEEEQHGHQ